MHGPCVAGGRLWITFSLVSRPAAAIQGSAEKNITLIPVDDPPVAIDATIVVREDGSYSGTVQGYDPEGGNITFSLGCPGRKGIAEIGDTPSLNSAPFNYSLMKDEMGTDEFIFSVSDGELEAYGMVRSITCRLLFLRSTAYSLAGNAAQGRLIRRRALPNNSAARHFSVPTSHFFRVCPGDGFDPSGGRPSSRRRS